jgi:hypothetical protein
MLDLGPPPSAFAAMMHAGRMMVPQSVMTKAVKKHLLDLSRLKGLPTQIAKPVALFSSKRSVTSRILQLRIDRAGDPIALVADYLNLEGRGFINLVKPIHPRPPQQYLNWERQGLCLYKS